MRIIIILVIIIISYYYNFHKSNNNNHINKTNNNDPSYELWDPLSSESLYSDAIFPIYFISPHLNSFYQFFSLSVSWITNSFCQQVRWSISRSVCQTLQCSIPSSAGRSSYLLRDMMQFRKYYRNWNLLP